METQKNHRWFWAHRRNASLLHMSFLMRGLGNNGWSPVVDFSIQHAAVVGVPDKGLYIFYDRDELSSRGIYKDVWQSIDSNPNFVQDFQKKSEELFGAVFSVCDEINQTSLVDIPQEELLRLYRAFLDAIMVGPIVSVQLWGIEACLDENYKIMQFLRERLAGEEQKDKIGEIREVLMTSTGETIAYREQRDFLSAAVAMTADVEVRQLFSRNDADSISEKLQAFPKANELFERHVNDYEWVHTEYVSGGWSREQWAELFRVAITAPESPQQKLAELVNDFEESQRRRQEIVDRLEPPQDVCHALDVLSEFIAQRDWSKGLMTKMFLSFHSLLDEAAQRADCSRVDLLNYTYTELDALLSDGRAVAEGELSCRKDTGFAFLVGPSTFMLVTKPDEISSFIQKYGLPLPRSGERDVSTIQGTGASRGKIVGRARVVEDASTVDLFQKGEVLVTYMTTVEFTPFFRKAGAVVTDEGGLSSHAAIVSREFGIPCIVGTQIATQALRTGDLIEVDATKGVITVLEHRQ